MVVLVCSAMDSEGFAMQHFDMASIAGACSRLWGARAAERHEVSKQRIWIKAIVGPGRESENREIPATWGPGSNVFTDHHALSLSKWRLCIPDTEPNTGGSERNSDCIMPHTFICVGLRRHTVPPRVGSGNQAVGQLFLQ